MRKAGLLGAAIGAVVLTAALASEGGAQPYSAKTLADLGNSYWGRGQCFDAAMNYYALLQQPPQVLGAGVIRQLRDRISQCRGVRVGVGSAGIDGKSDTVGRPPGGDRSLIVLPPARPPAAVTQQTYQIAGTLAPASQDVAASPRVRACRAYAETAVAQTQRLGATECGRRGGYRPFTYQQLYDWCTGQATPENVQADANRRAQALNSCTLAW